MVVLAPLHTFDLAALFVLVVVVASWRRGRDPFEHAGRLVLMGMAALACAGLVGIATVGGQLLQVSFWSLLEPGDAAQGQGLAGWAGELGGGLLFGLLLGWPLALAGWAVAAFVLRDVHLGWATPAVFGAALLPAGFLGFLVAYLGLPAAIAAMLLCWRQPELRLRRKLAAVHGSTR